MFIYNLLSHLNNSSRKEKDYISSMKYIKDIIEYMELLFPPLYPERLNFLEALGEVTYYKCSKSDRIPDKLKKSLLSEGIKAVEECCKNREIIYGKDYPLTIQSNDLLNNLNLLR